MSSIPANLTRKLQDQPYMLNRFDAAKFLGISLATLDRLVRDKAIPSAKIRGRRMFNSISLRRFVKQQEQQDD